MDAFHPDYATAADFSKWRAHAETLDTYALRWVIQDCRSAAANLRSFNPVREGYYEDQAFTYADELRARLTSP